MSEFKIERRKGIDDLQCEYTRLVFIDENGKLIEMKK
jgi:hypothetical protein